MEQWIMAAGLLLQLVDLANKLRLQKKQEKNYTFAAMRIAYEQVNKIDDIFLHLQLVGRSSVQQYDDDKPYRTNVTIGHFIRPDGSADMVYCHTPVFNAWHKRIWLKRAKEIPYRALVEFIESAGVYRVGFTSLPE